MGGEGLLSIVGGGVVGVVAMGRRRRGGGVLSGVAGGRGRRSGLVDGRSRSRGSGGGVLGRISSPVLDGVGVEGLVGVDGGGRAGLGADNGGRHVDDIAVLTGGDGRSTVRRVRSRGRRIVGRGIRSRRGSVVDGRVGRGSRSGRGLGGERSHGAGSKGGEAEED